MMDCPTWLAPVVESFHLGHFPLCPFRDTPVLSEASCQLAQVLHHSNGQSRVKEAQSRYERCLVLDPADHVKARRGLVRLLLDLGEADKARAVIDR